MTSLGHVTAASGVASVPMSRTFETVPVTGPGPDAFASLPFVPPASPKDASDIGAPIVENAPPPAPVVSEEEAKAVAMAMVTLFQLGVGQLLTKRPTLANNLAHAVKLSQVVDGCSQMVFASSARLAMKYNVRCADEVVVGAALSVAALGFVCKPEKNAPRVANGNVSKDSAGAVSEDSGPPVDESSPTQASGMSAADLAGIGTGAS